MNIAIGGFHAQVPLLSIRCNHGWHSPLPTPVEENILDLAYDVDGVLFLMLGTRSVIIIDLGPCPCAGGPKKA